MARPIPEGTHTVTPHLVIKGAAKAIDFYKKAFGAQEATGTGRCAIPSATCGQWRRTRKT
jgi:hypothetical protein